MGEKRDNNGIILKTKDGGDNWTIQSIGITKHLNSVYFTDLNTGWVVGWKFDYSGIILKTTDGGDSWTTQSIGTTEGLISVYFTDSNTGWAVGGGVLKTTNGGDNWTFQNNSTTDGLRSVYFTDLNTGWAVGDYGKIIKTTDGGDNWISQSSGTTKWLFSVYFTDSSTGWTVGDEGTILKTTNVGVTFTEKVIDEKPNEYILVQNYPNPFNPTTKIKYSIPNHSLVTLKVFDILGREIETLINEEKTAGYYEMNFNASQLSSGIYFYQLKAGEFTQTKKMLLIK